MRRFIPLLLLIQLAAPAFAVEAIRIFDDVEIFPLLPTQNAGASPLSWTQTGIPFYSCMAQSRTFTMHPGANTQLTSSGMTDDWIVVQNMGNGLPTGTPILSLGYDFPASFDLTFNGEDDRFRFWMDNIGGGDITMTVEVETASGTPGVADGSTTLTPNDGLTTVPFNWFLLSPSQWDQITSVRVHFESVSAANIHWRLHWIDVAGMTTHHGNGLVASENSDVFYELTPFPPPPYEAEWTWTDPSGGPYQIAHTDIGLSSSQALPTGPYPGEVVIHEESNDGSSLGMTVHSIASDIQEGRFLVGLEFIPNGTEPALFFPPNPVHLDQRLMIINVHVELRTPLDPAAHGGHLYHRLRFEIPEDSPMVFENPILDGFEGGNTVFLDFRIERQSGEVYGPGVAWGMNVKTDWRSHDFSTSAPMPVVGEYSLSARPNVTGAATHFWLDQAAKRVLELEIFDSRGRKVRQLQIPMGLQSVLWDVRDRHGDNLASGRYFARVMGTRQPAVRLTVLR